MINKKKKPLMQDLTVNPEEISPVEIQMAVQKKKEREHKKMLINNEYDKRFSMFRTKKLAVFYMVGGILVFLLIVVVMDAILTSAGYPSAIPL